MAQEFQETDFRNDFRPRSNYFANPAVKRTYPGVAALRSHRAPSAPVYAAYLRR